MQRVDSNTLVRTRLYSSRATPVLSRACQRSDSKVATETDATLRIRLQHPGDHRVVEGESTPTIKLQRRHSAETGTHLELFAAVVVVLSG